MEMDSLCCDEYFGASWRSRGAKGHTDAQQRDERMSTQSDDET